MESFEFESGEVLENVNVAYRTSGIPRYDDEGNITNAIIFCPTLRGGHSVLVSFHHQMKEKSHFDKDEYYFIRIISLGTPDSCSPSTTGLRQDFPEYTVLDRVNFKRQFLLEKFNVSHVLGLIGEGMGGAEILTWACEYPDDMEFIIVLNSSFKTCGYRHVFVRCAESIIDSSESISLGEYDFSLSKMVISINMLLFSGYFSKNIIYNATTDELDALMEDFVDEGLYMDIFDFKSRNECILGYDIEDKLSNIKAQSLFIGAYNYLFVDVERDVLPLGDLVKNSKVIAVYPNKKHYYEEEDFSDGIVEIISFLENFKE